jgi:hypothetical protein
LDGVRAGIVLCAGSTGPEEGTMLRTRNSVSLLTLIYMIIGLVIAFQRQYITVALIKAVVSALLAVFLWFLVLLGIDLHIP